MSVHWQDMHITKAIMYTALVDAHTSEPSEEKPVFDSAERLILIARSSHLE
jgi:hypothetical protein